MVAKEPDPYIGKRFGNYQVTAELKFGAFGRVYLAKHIHIDRVVAIKLLPAASVSSYKERQRFRREASILELLKHPFILPLLDYGIEDGFPYLVVEYAPNGSLRDLLESRPHRMLSIAETLTILAQVGDALHHAHENGIVHRDLKPENILFNAKREALLADFGIAIMQTASGFNQIYAITGTPPYMAPEQFRGIVDRYSDQYALGCIAYELLTGHRPFLAADANGYMIKHLQVMPAPPTRYNPALPRYMEEALIKSMAKRRLARHGDVKAFLRAMQIPPVVQEQLDSPHERFVLVLKQPEKTKEAWLEEGTRLRNLQLYEQALEAYDEALRIDPACARAFNNKGIAFYYMRQYEKALAMYNQAIHFDPNDAQPCSNKGITLYKLQRYSEALVAFEQAIRRNPLLIQAHYCKGAILCEMGRSSEALAAFEQCIRLNPTYALAHHGKGIVMKELT